MRIFILLTILVLAGCTTTNKYQELPPDVTGQEEPINTSWDLNNYE